MMKYLIIIIFALIIVPSAFAQYRDIDTTGCEKITLSSVIYRAVSLNIKHEKAFAVDPEFVFPPQGQSVSTLTPFPTTENGREITNAGFVINGTGTYTIKYAIEHAGERSGGGLRLMEIFIQSSGLPMIADQIRYNTLSICKIFEFQVTERPLIPTDEEIVQVAYGIITPVIERVEESVAINTDQAQRTSDRLSLIGLGTVVAFIIMVIIWHSSRKEKREITAEYALMKNQLNNFTVQQGIESRESERLSIESDARTKKTLGDFSLMFEVQMEKKIADLGHVIYGFYKALNDYNLNIDPIPEDEPELITNYDPSSPNYIPFPVEHDWDIPEYPPLLDYLKLEAEKIPIKSIKDKLFRKKKDETQNDNNVEVEFLQKRYLEKESEYNKLYKKYADPDIDPEEKDELHDKINRMSEELVEINKKIRESMTLGY